MKSIIFSILIAFLCLVQVSASEPVFNLKGSIHSAGSAVSFATINIKGSYIGTVSDANGIFTLPELKSGNYFIKVQSVGYKPKELPVSVPHNTNQLIIIELETDLIGLSEVVVTANRQETNRQEAPVIVNVINAGMLQASNAVCMADGLNFQSGLRVENNCQNCGFQQVRINGLEGPYTQILIDSRPIFSALSGVYGIEQIPAAMIDRIEIVRGGGSALYGSNAIAGTINVITREPLKNSFEAGFNHAIIGGRASDRNLSLNTTLVADDYRSGINLFAVNRSRGHYDANGDGFSELGLIKGNAMGFRSYLRISDNSKLTVTYHFLNEFRRGGNKFDLQPHESDITEQTDHKINGGELVFDLFSVNKKKKISIYTSAQHINRSSYYGAQQDMNAYGCTEDLSFVAGTQFTANIDRLILSKATLTSGAEWQRNSMHDQMPGYNRDLKQDISVAGLYAQSEWNLNRIKILLGARADRHNLISKIIISPRANVLVDLTKSVQWRNSFSTGFRAPQAFDEDLHIIAVNGGVMLIQLDPNLRPEYSKSFSSSLDSYFSYGSTQNNLMIEGFYTMLDEVFVLETLETDANGNMIVERRNGSGARVGGINIEHKTAFNEKLQLQLGFTLQKSRYLEPVIWSDNPKVESLKQLPKSPDQYGYLSLTYSPAKKLTAYITGTYTGLMKMLHFEGYIEQDEIVTTPSFLDLNLKLSYRFRLSNTVMMKLETGIQNIFDSYQSDFDKGMFRDAGYMYGPLKTRTIYFGLKVGS